MVDPVEKILGSRGGQQDVLDNVVLRHTILMQAMIERFGVEERVEEPTEGEDERDGEIGEDVAASPKGAAVVAKEVVFCGNDFCMGGGGGLGEQTFDVNIIPVAPFQKDVLPGPDRTGHMKIRTTSLTIHLLPDCAFGSFLPCRRWLQRFQ